jgi:hypothetical protein
MHTYRTRMPHNTNVLPAPSLNVSVQRVWPVQGLRASLEQSCTLDTGVRRIPRPALEISLFGMYRTGVEA